MKNILSLPKIIFTVLALTGTLIFAGDDAAKKTVVEQSPVQQISMEPFVLPGFYIGYNGPTSDKNLLTLQIQEAAIDQDQIHFQFIMNSSRERVNGYGTLDPANGWITLSNQFVGRFETDSTGILILESMPSDTLSHWYLKEKQ